MQAIDNILELLGNGEWHGLKEVALKTQLQDVQIELVSSFLAKYNFIDINRKEKKVKLSPDLIIFLRKIQDIEREEALTKDRTSGHLLFP